MFCPERLEVTAKGSHWPQPLLLGTEVSSCHVGLHSPSAQPRCGAGKGRGELSPGRATASRKRKHSGGLTQWAQTLAPLWLGSCCVLGGTQTVSLVGHRLWKQGLPYLHQVPSAVLQRKAPHPPGHSKKGETPFGA